MIISAILDWKPNQTDKVKKFKERILLNEEKYINNQIKINNMNNGHDEILQKRLHNIKTFVLKKHDDSFLIDRETGRILEMFYDSLYIKNLFHWSITCRELEGKIINGIVKSIDIVNIISRKLKGKKYVIHPLLIALFYKELILNGVIFEYDETYESIDIKYEYNNYKQTIKEQNLKSFKIIDKIYNNVYLKALSSDFFNTLLQDPNAIRIEKKSKNFRIDLEIKICENKKICIEINEQHHCLNNDQSREKQLYIDSNIRLVNFYTAEKEINQFMPQIWEEISYLLYSVNKIDSMVIYLEIVKQMKNLDFIKFIVETKLNLFDKNKGEKLKNIYDYLTKKHFSKNKFKIWFQELLIDGDIHQDHFIENIEDISEKNYYDLADKQFNHIGFHCLFMSTRNKYWNGSIETKNLYSKITNEYLSGIENIIANQNKEMVKLREEINVNKRHDKFNKIAFEELNNKIQNMSSNIKNKLNIKIHQDVWFLVEDIKSGGYDLHILEKILGKEKITEIKNKQTNDKFILGYREINQSEEIKILKFIEEKEISREIPKNTTQGISLDINL
ncbi:hypothetical protein CPAV1605_156 [seawater metagenome]|uniref:Uncharacterized protein n=1 Tax=seawater metagenome TaxID=1561972 RepID=A0A5E8CID1_9ZZZZ